MIEVETYRLHAGTDTTEFAATVADFQQEVIYRLPGLLRRTTAAADDGSWCTITLWDEHGPQHHDSRHPAAAARAASIDARTATRAVYRELRG